MKKIIKDIKGKLILCKEITFSRLGLQNDFVGYETLIEFIVRNKLYKLEGDFLEVGAFMGGGSVKLSKYANKYGKKLNVIDIFNPDFDHAKNDRGESLNWIYNKILGSRNLREVFDKNTKDEKNITVYAKDSRKVQLPADTKLCFTFIDGNHEYEYVKSDFHLAWDKTVSGGAIGFHDYERDLPEVTSAIKELIKENKSGIIGTEHCPEKNIMFVIKK
jgi:hypothetical protein